MRLHPLPVIALFTTLSFFTAADALHERAQRCPISCDSSIPSQWTSYHDPAYLSVCNETMLMYLAVYNPLEDPKTHSTIFACSTAETSLNWMESVAQPECGTDFNDSSGAFEFGWTGSADESAIDQTLAIGDAFQRYFNNSVNCDHNDLFAQAGRVVVGIHIDSHLEHSSASAAAIQQLTSIIKSANGVFNQTVLQVCDSGSEWTLGVSVNTQGDLTSLQKHMRTWNDGKCVDDVVSKKKIANISLRTSSRIKNLSAIRNSTALEARSMSTHHGHHHHHNRALHTYHRRSTCSYVQVVSGDSCASLVQECGITTAEFTKYNPASDLCSTLAVGQYVCCSEGDLPDFSPKPYSNGTCYTYTVQSGDYCSALASSYSITVDDIEDFNSLTWGWMGCDDLQAGQTICLSDGEPPFPAPISNAVCGPQVPGTAQPTGDDDSPWFWAALNPCPLNACCDIWGQCGITPDYCTPSESPTGAPGTAAAGTNGCIDSCGTEIINDADGPDVFMAVGYYEGFNYNRDCLYMAASSVDTSKYTHIHYAFGNISSSYEVSVSDDEGTFSDFQKLPDVKKIISFGGWDFSTDPSTYSIFRQGVTSANRQSLANNVVDFVTNNNLDGVDFDWEYPGAPDIPGIPAGSDDEGDNYLEFLKLVRNGLPSDKTLSIAAPASYWYLQAFPISNISTVVDYIIYMTYDLHGQWDYGSTWAQDGCPAGNCLRSHVNLTETVLSLAMITKAGVATKQVVVGVTSYGRGFEMTDSGCTGPMCTFTGPDSGATPGRCTNTAGYIANAEIDLLISDNNSTQVLFDSDTDSDIIVYDSVQWVAYMTNTTKSTRTEYYQSLNMAGTSEWAIDLESFGSSDANMTQWDPCTSTYATLDAIEANASNIPDYCINTYIVGVQQAILNESLANYTDIINDGYDDKFDTYSNYIKEVVPEELKSYMAANASRYFTCKTETYIQCCKDCSNAYACSSGCSSDSDCVTGYANVTSDCPGTIPEPDNDTFQTGIFPVIYECNDEDGFREEIEDLYGILPSWTEFGKLLVQIDAGCEGSSDPCTSSNIYYYGFPITTDFEVPNPKDLISSSLTNLTIINDMLAEAYTNMYIDIWTANESAAVDSATLPTSMTKYAVQSMAKVAAEGAAIEAAEKKEMILSFVLGVLFLLPSLGEAIDAAELATLGRAVSLVGDVGNIGASIYGIVEDPKSAVFAVFGLLVAGRSDPEDSMESAKVAWREVSIDTIAKLGSDVKAEVDKVDSLKVPCI